MNRAPPLTLFALTLLGACASTSPHVTRDPLRPRAQRVTPVAPVAPRVNPPAPSPIVVRATAPEPLEFNITANSDLPPAPASTAQPYARIVESSLAPLRPALAECLRPLGAPARHTVRITVDEEGTLLLRPPQEFTLDAPDARCLDGVLRAGRVEPAPPRAIPYDLRVDVAQ
jgi:hypothetical protein